MAASEDSGTYTGDGTDDLVGYGSSATHRHTDPNNMDGETGSRDSQDQRQGQDRNQFQGQYNPDTSRDQNWTQDRDGTQKNVIEYAPTATTTSSIEGVTPVSTAEIFPSDISTLPPDSSNTSTDVSDAAATVSSNGGGNGMKSNTKVAIAVPVAIGGAALIAGVILLVMFMRRRKQHKQERASLLPAANNRVEMRPAPAAATMAMPSQTQTQTRNIDMSPPFDPQQPPPSYQPTAETGNSRDPNAAGIGMALTAERQAPPSPSSAPPRAGTTAAAARNSHTQDNDNGNRAQSPFDDPIPDTFSAISRVSGRRRDVTGSIISSVSSIDDYEIRGHG